MKKIAPWLTIILYLVVVLSFIGAKKDKIKCKNVNVNIIDKTNNFFIEKKDVLTMLEDKGEELIGQNINDVNVNKLEEMLLVNPSVKDANVYRTINGNIEIEIKQRNPILRIINKNKESFYVDDTGKIMPLSNKYTAHVLIASGDINLSYTKLISLQTHNKIDTLLLNINKLSKYIYNDRFLKSQIEQIYVNKSNFELIPIVGTQIIEFGDIQNYKEKFNKLKALYKQGFSKMGWNKYKIINLKYYNQVICTKK